MVRGTDNKFMQRALQLAERGKYKTSPNPMVGAVLVKNGQIVGEGYHRRAGTDHAEIVALKQAKDKAAGSTLYVTLEPCCHSGRTGPCTDAIIRAGIKQVVVAVKDPDKRVNGKGIKILRKAGIAVTVGVLQKEAVQLNELYFGYYKLGRPFVVLKIAQTLDGRIATSTGDSKWITSAIARKEAHALRAQVDGIVVGMETVREDNPALTVRNVAGINPYRIVLTRSLRFPSKCQLLDNNNDYKTIVATTAVAAEKFAKTKRGHNLIYWRLREKRNSMLHVNDLVHVADSFGLRSLLVEGGSMVATDFLQAGLVDKIVVFIAPLILGEGKSAVGNLKKRKIEQALALKHVTYSPKGTDCMFVGYPDWKK